MSYFSKLVYVNLVLIFFFFLFLAFSPKLLSSLLFAFMGGWFIGMQMTKFSEWFVSKYWSN